MREGGLTLAIDSSAALGGVGLSAGEVLLGSRELGPPGQQAETVLVAIDALLHDSGRELAEVGLIAVALGPGSFTGLRIGLSAAQGIGFGRDIPVIGVPTTTIRMAWARLVSEDRGSSWVALLDARRSEAFLATGRSAPDDPFDLANETSPVLISLTELTHRLAPSAAAATSDRPMVVCGEGVPAAAAELAALGADPAGGGAMIRLRTISPPRPPDAVRLLAALGRRRFAIHGAPPLLEPLYVREPDARKPRIPVLPPGEAS
ncbi:MAG TPA: tRNA (adenosine(37)-N6)-threonylcarbamoyltransferase complex dimerization subunit type 1 TsaB [Candidatus Eisenbacteria bacterium]